MTKLTVLSSLACLWFLCTPVISFWRLQCFGVVAQGRVDPIISPGTVSGHVHTLKGSNGISPNATVDSLLASSCTSCEVAQDHSAYWAPQLYFFAANGTISAVPEVAGHLTYYKYTPCYTSSGNLQQPEAMPNGLRMISGDPFRRNFTLPVPDPPLPWSGADVTQEALAQKAIGFNCLNYNKAPEPSLYRHFMPNKAYLDANCASGLRMEVLFPYCWNGELDSADHRSHLAYPTANLNGGTCPPGYDRVINQLFFETIYPVQNYVGQDGFFAFAQGDPTGYGYHGDALIAWEGDTLRQATSVCGPLSGPDASGVISDCPFFHVTSPDTQAACKAPTANFAIQENVLSNLQSLPGNNPLQYGPQEATIPSSGRSAQHPTSASQPSLPYKSATMPGFTDTLGNVYHETVSAPSLAPQVTPTTLQHLVKPSAPISSAARAAVPPSASACQPSAPPASLAKAFPSDETALTTVYSTVDGTVIGLVIVAEATTVTLNGPPSRVPALPARRWADHLAAHRRGSHL